MPLINCKISEYAGFTFKNILFRVKIVLWLTNDKSTWNLLRIVQIRKDLIKYGTHSKKPE